MSETETQSFSGGRKSLQQILDDNDFNPKHKGLTSLFSKNAPEVLGADDEDNQDIYQAAEKNGVFHTPAINNEQVQKLMSLLQKIDSRSEEVEKLKDTVSELNTKLTLIEKGQEHSFQSLSDKLSQKEGLTQIKKMIIGAGVISTLAIIALMGQLLTSSSNEVAKVSETPVKPPIVAPVEVKSFVVTTKFVNMRTMATPKSDVITTLNPNIRLEQVDTKGGWRKVKFFDHQVNKTRTGWVWYEHIAATK